MRRIESLIIQTVTSLVDAAEQAGGKVVFMDSGAGASTRAVQGILGMQTETTPPPAPHR